jgi:UDP-N-acetylmuramyl pentapeptide phosphotransferase/UDP-N-acetylglucosamine-1-phosphate transferase
MKNKISGFALILAACAVIYAIAVFVPFGKNVNLADFVKGFAIGVGVIISSALVVLLVKKAREKSEAV